MRNFKVYIDGQEYEVSVEEVGVETSAPVVAKQEVKTQTTLSKPSKPQTVKSAITTTTTTYTSWFMKGI